MRILIAEDDADSSESYKDVLEARNHLVMLTENGEECLKIYSEELKREQIEIERKTTPFDAVILDYMMPRKDGMQVAKEILEMNPKQRIIFASAYVEETLEDAVKQLKQVVEHRGARWPTQSANRDGADDGLRVSSVQSPRSCQSVTAPSVVRKSGASTGGRNVYRPQVVVAKRAGYVRSCARRTDGQIISVDRPKSHSNSVRLDARGGDSGFPGLDSPR
jgi:CheY-like chemotaxis protein